MRVQTFQNIQLVLFLFDITVIFFHPIFNLFLQYLRINQSHLVSIFRLSTCTSCNEFTYRTQKGIVTYLSCYFEWPKNTFASSESLFSFVNSNPAHYTTQKLVLVIIGHRWLRFKWFNLEKNGHIFQVLPAYLAKSL